MSLAPLLEAGCAIQLPAFAAIAALLLGIVQMAAPKGILPHRALGWLWAGLMMLVAVSSFWIHEIRSWGQWSPIHLLSILVLVTVPLSVYAARKHKVAQHRRGMIMLFAFALIVTGGFTLLPGRIMHAVVFGS